MLAVAMALDLLLLQLFSQRLHIGDLFHFGGQMGANWSVLRSSLQSTPGFITAIAALGTLSLLLNACRAGGLDARVGKWLIVLAVPSLALARGAQALRPVQYVHASLVENVVSVNLAQGSTREFSTTHIDRQRGLLARTPRICQANPQADRPNVIILLAESLSSWHSKLLGSANDLDSTAGCHRTRQSLFHPLLRQRLHHQRRRNRHRRRPAADQSARGFRIQLQALCRDRTSLASLAMQPVSNLFFTPGDIVSRNRRLAEGNRL